MAINRDKILKSAEKLVQKGKIEQAIREYEKLLKLNANDVNTINRVGDLYNRIGQVDKAVELYERIANAFATDGFFNKAIAMLKKINRLAPDRVDVFKRLAELYLQQGLIFEAKSQYQTLADWYIKNDDLDGGIDINRKLVEIDSDNHIAHLRLADLLLRKGEGVEGVSVYDRLGRMLLEAGKTEEAERLYRHALEQNPPQGEFVAPMCETLVESGSIATAQEFYNTAQKISPKSDRLKVIGLRLALGTGESAKALEMSQQLLKTHRLDSTITILAGKALLAGGEGIEGRDILLPHAEEARAKGDLEVPREIFTNLIKVLPQDRLVLQLGLKVLSPKSDGEMLFAIKAALADNYFRSGDTDLARNLYEELRTEEPENQVVCQRLEVLGAPSRSPSSAAAAGPPASEQAPKPKASEDISGNIEVLDFESDPEIIEFELPAEDISFPDVDTGTEIEGGPQATAQPSDEPSFDPAERIAEASVFAKYGLFDKAIDHLKQVINAFPEEHKARERLVLLAIEAGQTELALSHADDLKQYYIEQGLEEALSALYRSLPELKEKADAAPEMEEPTFDGSLEDIELVEIDDAPPLAEEATPAVAFDTPDLDHRHVEDDVLEPTEIELEAVEFEAVDMDSLKPAEGLEFEVLEASDFEGDPEKEALIKEPEGASPGVIPPTGPDQAQIEKQVAPPTPKPAAASLDILGELAELEESLKAPRSPLASPSMPAEETPKITSPGVEVETIETIDEPVLKEPGAQHPETEAPSPDTRPESDDLDQLQTFLEHSLYEDATRILGRLESEIPGNPVIVEARRLLKSKGLLVEDLPQATEAAEDLFADEASEYVDLAAELEEEMAAEEALVSEAAGSRDSEADLEDVFREFQKGVSEQLSEEDADTHFNLGIAYKEMGLLPEAIREFQIASRSDEFFVEGCSMIGICYSEQGMWEQSATWYSKALSDPKLSPTSVLALKYDLAGAMESSGDQGGAMEVFEEILSVDPTYRNTRQRLDHLAGSAQAN